ncbi:MAG: hypothetical protein ACPG31_07555 [Planctomycetota bacterium]
MRLTAALTAIAFCCTTSLVAQQIFVTGETVELPSNRIGAADHATIAANSFGDVLVANHAEAANGDKLVEATAIGSLGSNTFILAPTILLGDPSLQLVGEDTCRKPDVVVLADDTFVVVWPRNDKDSLVPARLEAARVIFRDGNGDLYPRPIVETAAPGEGYIIDPSLESGSAGIMPDLVAMDASSPQSCAVVYVHESDNRVNGDRTYREHDLRCVKMDWSELPQSPQFLDGPHVLLAQVPMDETTAHPFVGGMVLPDVVLDDSGNLVVVHEESLVAPHFGWQGQTRTRIAIDRFSGFDATEPLDLLNSWTIVSGTDTHRPRRPMAASSREDAEDSVSVTWGEQATTGFDNDLGYKMVLIPTTGDGLEPRDAYWIADPLNEDAMPVVADDGRMRTCFAVRNYPNHRSLLLSATLNNGTSTIQEISTPIEYPWRPAAELVTVQSPGGHDLTYAAVTYEGADVFNTDQYAIYFTYRLW